MSPEEKRAAANRKRKEQYRNDPEYRKMRKEYGKKYYVKTHKLKKDDPPVFRIQKNIDGEMVTVFEEYVKL